MLFVKNVKLFVHCDNISAVALGELGSVLRCRELREKSTTMTLINICVCLVLVYLFFAIGVGRVSHHQTCNGLTFILHYFTLACFAWMSINAYQMLRAFTSVSCIHYFRCNQNLFGIKKSKRLNCSILIA